MRCLIGLDDTDSRFGHCTTHLGYQVVSALLSGGCTFRHYPRLVRLNPNVPFKTRGNAAVCLDFDTQKPEEAFDAAESLFRDLSDVDNGANAGIVFFTGASDAFRPLYEAAVSGLVNPARPLRILDELKVRYATLGNGMGVVGAAASLGFSPRDDHTYELIAYRKAANCGTSRSIDSQSVRSAESRMFPHVFSSYDYGKGRVLIAPHGPDPVFLGIRADSPTSALESFRMVEYEEELAGHMVYLSNQCTDAHLTRMLALPPSAYSAGWLEGSIESLRVGEGKHLYIQLEVDGTILPSAIYEPAGDLLFMARRLMKGDRVRLFGGIRRGTPKHPAILNVEKVEVLSLAPKLLRENPTCKECGGKTKSEGKGKGFQCRSCGARSRSSSKALRRVPREIYPGVYLPSPRAQRHLTKQLVRYGRELHTEHALVDEWVEPDRVPHLRQQPQVQ